VFPETSESISQLFYQLKQGVSNMKIKGKSIIKGLSIFAVVCILGFAVYFIGNSVIKAQNKSDEADKTESLQVQDSERNDDDDDDGDSCDGGRGAIVMLPSTKLYIEHNSTDEDTGVHGLFDGVNWKNLCVYDPRGRLILKVDPKRQFRTQSISGIFFESAEPPNEEVPIEEIFARFPEGRYSVRGRTENGKRLRGSAIFTHKIPAGPEVIYPQDGSTIPASGLVVMWNHVTTTIDGEPIERTGYEIIITKENADDPNGFSRPVYDVHVPASVTSLSVPNEFLEPGTEYELEVLALEVSGNQTITVKFFNTAN
jgi:hypothetical protein